MISIVYFSKKCLHQERPFEELLRVQLSQLITFIPYSGWVGFIGKFINVVATFAWNFMDLFVMILSIGLSSRFKQINEEMQRVKGEVGSYKFHPNDILFIKKNVFISIWQKTIGQCVECSIVRCPASVLLLMMPFPK